MQVYDVTLKLLLHRSATRLLQEVTDVPIAKWLDVELPKVQNLRADLLGETADGGLIHIELQSSNDSTMPLRMAEYSLGVYRLLNRFPRQVVLYVGDQPLRMNDELLGPDCSYRYRLIDVRELDGEGLLSSPDIGDNVIAILTRLSDYRDAARRIVKRIASVERSERDQWLAQLMILAAMRRLEIVIREEAQELPIDIDIRDNLVLGPMFRKAEEDGEKTVLRRQMAKRFGNLPLWVDEKLAAMNTTQLEELADRVLDAVSLEDLFRPC